MTHLPAPNWTHRAPNGLHTDTSHHLESRLGVHPGITWRTPITHDTTGTTPNIDVQSDARVTTTATGDVELEHSDPVVVLGQSWRLTPGATLGLVAALLDAVHVAAGLRHRLSSPIPDGPAAAAWASRPAAARSSRLEDRIDAADVVRLETSHDTPCPNDGELVNVRCWKCGWVRPATTDWHPNCPRCSGPTHFGECPPRPAAPPGIGGPAAAGDPAVRLETTPDGPERLDPETRATARRALDTEPDRREPGMSLGAGLGPETPAETRERLTPTAARCANCGYPDPWTAETCTEHGDRPGGTDACTCTPDQRVTAPNGHAVACPLADIVREPGQPAGE